MPRIRTVKPELFFDVELGEVSIPARFLFIGLFTQADRRGRLEDSPKKIKANIFPYDERVNVDAMLNELSKKFIIRYEISGRKYIQIMTFEKNQRISGKEMKYESIFPPVPEASLEAFGKQSGSNGEAVGKHLGSNGDGGESQEREREQEQERDVCMPYASHPKGHEAADPSLSPFLDFPVIGQEGASWILTEAKVAEYKTTFPHLNVENEARKARQWLTDNPARRKTARGMTRFLFSWLERSQNSKGGGNGHNQFGKNNSIVTGSAAPIAGKYAGVKS
jgi:hypothetical protein